jgi:hypothetical protein
VATFGLSRGFCLWVVFDSSDWLLVEAAKRMGSAWRRFLPFPAPDEFAGAPHLGHFPALKGTRHREQSTSVMLAQGFQSRALKIP